MSLKILITGGAGFIGRHLTQLLQTKSHQIVWLDNLDPQIHGDHQDPKDILPHPDIKFIVGNVCDRSAWLQAIQGVDAIVNFAPQTGTRQSMYQIARYTDKNIGGTGLMTGIISIFSNKMRQNIPIDIYENV